MKKASGFYLSAVTLLLTVAAIAAYIINCGTAYFSAPGVCEYALGSESFALILRAPAAWNIVVLGCLMGGALASLLAMCTSRVPFLGHLFVILAPMATIYGVMMLLNDRIGGIAAVFTFENNAQNMADLTSCLVALGAGALAVLFGIITSFNAFSKKK